MIEKLREELHMAIEKYGINHEKTIEISQRLDVEIVKDQKERTGMNLNVNIKVKVYSLEEYEEILKRVKESLEKECNCTCTLHIEIF